MEIAIERLAVVCFFVTGVSHVVQPRVWAQFFIDLSARGSLGSFIAGFIHFPFGALIVGFHNVFHGIPLVLTLIGYSLVLKSMIYFVVPRLGVRSLSRVSLDHAWEFVVAGILSIGLSACGIRLITRGSFLSGQNQGQAIADHIKTVALPGLGTGVGKVGFNTCAHQVRTAINDILLQEYQMPQSWVEASERHQLLYTTKLKRLQY